MPYQVYGVGQLGLLVPVVGLENPLPEGIHMPLSGVQARGPAQLALLSRVLPCGSSSMAPWGSPGLREGGLQ